MRAIVPLTAWPSPRQGVHELVRHGHEVYVEQDADLGPSIPNADFDRAGAKILPTADDVWETGDLILLPAYGCDGAGGEPSSSNMIWSW
jgi:hypothetical protein